jgi:hypothetical protein
MKLFLLDGIGPFFRNETRRRINWSKIPFDNLETGGQFDPARFHPAADDFARLADRATEIGFTGLTLDDLAHLAGHPDANPDLRDKVARYREAYRRLFAIAADRGLKVYITTDIMYEPAYQAHTRPAVPAELALESCCTTLFRECPRASGVIFRLGECDGLDVRGDFRSRLAIRTPTQAHALIRRLIPLFERHDKLLILRTWTVGAYRIGDLIWNRQTFDQVLDGLDSRCLVLSMKYGETDFFRYLPINPLFFRSRHQKIVELQARREYEGFGEFPSFIGWDYETYARQLVLAPNMVGAWVWCQTGGWSGFRRRTFLEPAGLWNELNAVAALRVMKDGLSANDAVRAWARRHLGLARAEKLLTLLQLSDETIREGLYMDDVARRPLFFRRLRMPPLLAVYWDQIFITHAMRQWLRCFVRDPEDKRRQGRAVLDKIRAMQGLAAELGLPTADFDFQYDTFEILTAARDYYFGPVTPKLVEHLRRLKAAYEAKYPHPYLVRLDFRRFPFSRTLMRWLISLLFRPRGGYRWMDRLILIRLLSLLAPLLDRGNRRKEPDRVVNQAMGLKSVLQ